MRKKIVVSAINIYYGGTLSIVNDALAFLSENLAQHFDIIALVHKKSLFSFPGITYYEFPDSRSSWFKRLYYEYYYFKGFSKEIRPYLWLSLHDVSPRVEADIQAVYCHNAAIFYKLKLKEAPLDKVFAAFTLFYKQLYRFNIHSNTYVIVQQNWIRNAFSRLFALPLKKIVVAYPELLELNTATTPVATAEAGTFRFFYPSFPRVFKNFEVICDAALLLKARGVKQFEVVLTTDTTETAYATKFLGKYKGIAELHFIGKQSRERILELYQETDCMIFPSKLETWGLPITECKVFGKPILLADLPYAKETIGSYDHAAFFNPEDPIALANLMQGAIEEKPVFKSTKAQPVDQPFTQSWEQLFNLLLTKQP